MRTKKAQKIQDWFEYSSTDEDQVPAKKPCLQPPKVPNPPSPEPATPVPVPTPATPVPVPSPATSRMDHIGALHNEWERMDKSFIQTVNHAETDELESDIEDNSENLMNEFAKKWMLCELTHKISKTASNELWKLAFQYIPYIKRQKHAQFAHIRRTLYKENVPEIQIKTCYKQNSTDEVTYTTDTISTQKDFPAGQYTNCLLYTSPSPRD